METHINISYLIQLSVLHLTVFSCILKTAKLFVSCKSPNVANIFAILLLSVNLTSILIRQECVSTFTHVPSIPNAVESTAISDITFPPLVFFQCI